MSLQGSLQMKRFEQVSSDGHQMSLAWSWGLDGYSEVKLIMGNFHIGTPVHRMTDWRTDKYENITFATSLFGGNNRSSGFPIRE